ncbi:hypothetical protein [Paracoccus sp. (in: a-proteobacteria)]|uniref:hypothetical protein n=1 Tax=Paracoccus sp. TaxID=267 RepID=UPI0028A0A5A0|nr:hypothetical protein [Paracoccus sp. (in: a-proteobacteria)]
MGIAAPKIAGTALLWARDQSEIVAARSKTGINAAPPRKQLAHEALSALDPRLAGSYNPGHVYDGFHHSN